MERHKAGKTPIKNGEIIAMEYAAKSKHNYLFDGFSLKISEFGLNLFGFYSPPLAAYKKW